VAKLQNVEMGKEYVLSLNFNFSYRTKFNSTLTGKIFKDVHQIQNEMLIINVFQTYLQVNQSNPFYREY